MTPWSQNLALIESRKVITTYRIRGIALDNGRCWLNVKPGESDSFLVVEGCAGSS